MSITYTEETVTPKMASEILEEHYDRIAKSQFSQRRISQAIVNRYAADMRVGNWVKCPQPIVLDEKGNLVDGQHRLEAVRKSGKSVVMVVSRGWPVSELGNGITTIDTIDRGRPRSTGAQLSLHGFHNANQTASAVSSIARLINGGTPIAVSYASTHYILDTLDLRRHIQKIYELNSSRNTFGGRVLGPLSYYRTISAKKADDFAERLHNLEMEKNTGVWVFARYMRDRIGVVDQRIAIRALCSCLRAWHDDTPISFIRPNAAACYWLAKQNKKLCDAIVNLLRVEVPENTEGEATEAK